jgi:hypothetical protein
MIKNKMLDAAEYVFARLKNSKEDTKIKLVNVSPRDITIDVIKGVELLEEFGLIKFSKGLRLLDKDLSKSELVEKSNSFAEFQELTSVKGKESEQLVEIDDLKKKKKVMKKLVKKTTEKNVEVSVKKTEKKGNIKKKEKKENK